MLKTALPLRGLRGLGFRGETEMRYAYKDSSGLVECELLHEFLEEYQIQYIDRETGEKIEEVVRRELVREIHNS